MTENRTVYTEDDPDSVKKKLTFTTILANLEDDRLILFSSFS